MARTDADRSYPYYPAFLDLRRKRVIVVGGGEIATGKVRGLLPCGPEPLIVIAPTASGLIRRAAKEDRLLWQRREYLDGDLAGADYVFAATDDRATNAVVAGEARSRRILVLAVDDVPNCDFIAPALVQRGDLTVAISTGGRSPAFARWARERLEETVTPDWGNLLEVAARVRDRLGQARSRVSPEAWQMALGGEVRDLVQAGRLNDAEAALLARLMGEMGGAGPNPLAPFPPREGGTGDGRGASGSPFPGREGGEGVRSGPEAAG
jgi:siroheme synthase-like protein